jgi:hypothetical protein
LGTGDQTVYVNQLAVPLVNSTNEKLKVIAGDVSGLSQNVRRIG